MELYKLGTFPDQGPHTYAKTFMIQETTGPDRLVIAPESHQIELLLQLAELLPEPFGILYVLTTPRGQSAQPARYQSPHPSPRTELRSFLYRFQEFLEQDGRHHIWVVSLAKTDTLVYDNHNIIYAYGPLEQFERTLIQQGFKNQPTEIPYPHTHCYHAEFDAAEHEIMTYWQWQGFPLQNTDDDV